MDCDKQCCTDIIKGLSTFLFGYRIILKGSKVRRLRRIDFRAAGCESVNRVPGRLLTLNDAIDSFFSKLVKRYRPTIVPQRKPIAAGRTR